MKESPQSLTELRRGGADGAKQLVIVWRVVQHLARQEAEQSCQETPSLCVDDGLITGTLRRQFHTGDGEVWEQSAGIKWKIVPGDKR